MWTVNRMLGCIALVATACCAVPGAHAASLRAASGNVEDAVESTNGLNVPLGWSFDAQSPPTEGDYYSKARPLLALVAGKKSDRLGNSLPQGAMVSPGEGYTETISAGVVSDNVAWAKSQSSDIGIDASFLGMFSAGVDYKNMASSSFAQSTTQQYVQIGGALELQRVTLPTGGLELTGEAVDALQALPPLGDSDSLAAYAAFFNLWDAHIITEYVIGGTAHMFSSFDSSITAKSSISSNTVGAYVKATFAEWGAGVSGSHSWTQQQGQVLAQATSDTSIRCRGGDAGICAGFSISNSSGAYDKWVASITVDGLVANAAIIATSTEPLWSDAFDPDFLPTPTLAADLKKAYAMYLSACPGAMQDNGFICAGRGQCDLTGTASGGNGTCDCFPGYGGSLCTCPSDSPSTMCSGHGTCSMATSPASPGSCTCDYGYGGKDCGSVSFSCPTDDVFGTGECGVTNYNGKCNTQTGKCVCAAGRTGAACNIPCGGDPMTTAIGPPTAPRSTWWDLAYTMDNRIGIALYSEDMSIRFAWKDGMHTSHEASSTSISTGSNHDAFDNPNTYPYPDRYADGVCQFVFNYVVGQGSPDGSLMAQIPVQQVRPTYFQNGYLTFLGHSIWQLADYGYEVSQNMTQVPAGLVPKATVFHDFNDEYSGTGYSCTAVCEDH